MSKLRVGEVEDIASGRSLSVVDFAQTFEYGAGVKLTSYNQLVRHLGKLWQLKGNTPLPYTTTGSGPIEEGVFVGTDIGEALSDLTSPGGAALIGNALPTVDTLSDLINATWLKPGLTVQTLGYYVEGDGGGGVYSIEATTSRPLDMGGAVSLAGMGGVALLQVGIGGVDVRQFGAKGDYVVLEGTGQDCTLNLQAAADYLSSTGGGTLYLPRGIYKISDALNFTDVPIRVVGDGKDHTTILQVGVGKDNLVYTATLPTGRVDGYSGHGGARLSITLQNLKLATTVKAGAGLRGTWQDVSNNAPTVIVDSVEVVSLANTAAGYMYGLHLTDVSSTRLINYRFAGDAGSADEAGATPYYSEAAIKLVAVGGEGNINHFWHGVTLSHANRAVDVEGWYEGFYIVNFEFAFVGYGVRAIGATAESRDIYILSLVNGHMDFRASAITAKDTWGILINGCDLIHSGATAQAVSGNLVEVTDSSYLRIVNSMLHGSTFPDAEDGIVLDNVQNYTIDVELYDLNGIGFRASNSSGDFTGQVRNVGQGVLLSGESKGTSINNVTYRDFNQSAQGGSGFGTVLDSTCSGAVVLDCTADSTVNLNALNNGVGNIIKGNVGGNSGHRAVSDGGASLDVGLTGVSAFKIENSTATTIDSFVKGYDGQVVRLVFLTGNTTLANQAEVAFPLILKGYAPVTPVFGQTMEFILVDGNWFEVGRSF